MTALTPQQMRELATRPSDGLLDHQTWEPAVRVSLRAAADEVARLRSALDSAPHAEFCRHDRTDALAYRGAAANCTCWKRGAL